MRSDIDKPSAAGADLPPAIAGVGCAMSGVGIGLALADVDSALRAPFILFFLFAGPACGLYAVLPRLEAAARASVAATGALLIDLLVAQSLSSVQILTFGGGIAAVTLVTALLFLRALGVRMRNPAHADATDRLREGIKHIRSGRSSPTADSVSKK